MLMTAVRGVDHRLAPLAGRERAQAAQDGGATPPNGDKPDAAVVQLRQLGIGHDLGINVQPLGIDSGELRPQLDTLERLASLVTPSEMRVGLAYDLALVLVRADAQHTGPGFATPGQGVLVTPGGIAPKRERVNVQGKGVGLRKQPRRHGADPAREYLVLMVASGARGIGGRVGFLGGPSEARKQAHGLVAVQVVAVATPFFVQKLQDEHAQQRTGRGHHCGARRAGLADQLIEAHTGQQGQEENPPRDARAQATSRSKAQRARIGDDGRLWDSWCWDVRLPLGSPQGRLPKKGGASPACMWARNRQTIERNEVSREPNCWAISCRRRPAMKQARSASYWRWEVATGSRKKPRQPVFSMSQTS